MNGRVFLGDGGGWWLVVVSSKGRESGNASGGRGGRGEDELVRFSLGGGGRGERGEKEWS